MKAIWSDESKYAKWLLIELAASEAWAAEGVVPEEDMALLRDANYDAERLKADIQAGSRHEMTAFLSSITRSLGPEGRWLHLGLTTSDVWDTATSLQLVEAVDLLDGVTKALMEALKQRALEHKDTLMIGRTHGVHAEPITFGLKLALWWDEMRRNISRLAQAREVIAVGKLSGPVGTHATVPPLIQDFVCDQLGLEPARVSNQVLQRDRHAQFVTSLALVAASLEKFATEIRSLQRTEIREVMEDFPEGQPGSSSMPHKRNPELSERVCGLARLMRGYAVTAMENVALWGERDISHSSTERIIFPDACMALDYMLDIFAGVIRDLRVFPERMRHNMDSTRGVLFSQRVLLALVENGVSREDAYEAVHRNSMESWREDKDFGELLLSDPEVSVHLDANDIDGLFSYGYYVRHMDDIFRRIGLEQ